MPNLVIFDFCETMIRFQTADRFVDYVVQNSKHSMRFWIYISKIASKRPLSALFNRIFPGFNFNKRVKLLALRGIPESEISHLSIQYAETIENETIEPVMRLLYKHSEMKDHIVLISGGYTNYLYYFAKKYHFKSFFGTQIKFHKGYCKGIFDGADCMHGIKLVVLKKYLKENEIKYDTSICYTDSITDLPILEWADKAVVVSRNQSQTWAKSRNYQEIIWS